MFLENLLNNLILQNTVVKNQDFIFTTTEVFFSRRKRTQATKPKNNPDLRPYLRIALCISTAHETLAFDFAKQLGSRQTNQVFFFSRKRVPGPDHFLFNSNAAITVFLYREYRPISITG